MKSIRKIGVSLVVLAGVTIGVTTSAHAQTDTTFRWGSYSINSNSHEVDSATAVGNLSGVAAIDAANSSDEILTASGAVYTVGTNIYGELGTGDTTAHPTNAVQVSLPWTATAIGEADNTDTATNGSGSTDGWGENSFGQLCLGNTNQQNSPVDITALDGINISAMTGGGTHILYQTGPDTILACGGNQYGELGNGTFADSTTPVSVNTSAFGSSPIVAISAARSTSTVLLADGTIWMWGLGKFGQLGYGGTADRNVPTKVNLPTGVTASEVYSGGDTVSDGQTVALTSAGPMAWGYNQNGELDNGNTTNQTSPVAMSLLPSGHTWAYVATGGKNTLAMTDAGDVYSSGNDQYGQVGDGYSSGNVLTPVKVFTGADMISTTADDVIVHSSTGGGPVVVIRHKHRTVHAS